MITVWLGVMLAAAPQASSYRVGGVVLNAVTRQPVAGARVTLAPMARPEQPLAMVTGADGRFVFAGIPAGRYELGGSRRGLLSETLASAIVTGQGEDTERTVLRLAPPAIISGKVVDDIGDPVEHALVELLRSRIVDGRRRLTNHATTQTNDLGEYRFSVPPGSYYLTVSGCPWYTKFQGMLGDAAPASMTHVGYGAKYYPNVSEPSAAEALLVKAGQEAAANFALLPVPAAALHLEFENGENLTKHFTLTAGGLPGSPVFVRQGTEPGDSYNFFGVPQGHYTLQTEVAGSDTLYATSEIDVGASDTEVNVHLQDSPTLTGTLALEGGGSLPAGLIVVLHEEDTGRTIPSPVTVNGTFSIPAIPPQRYRLNLSRADEFYLKSWSVEGARRDGELLEIPAGAKVRLKLFAGKGAGSIHGTVDRDGHPVSGALVVLNHRAVASASDGSYEFRGLPPGEYALFAVADGADLEYANPAAIRPYLGSAENVRVAPGGSYSQRLEIAPVGSDVER